MTKCLVKVNKRIAGHKLLNYAVSEINNRILQPDYFLNNIVGKKLLGNFLPSLTEISVTINDGHKGLKEQGYVIKAKKKNNNYSIEIIGADVYGILYAVRDLHHYHLKDIILKDIIKNIDKKRNIIFTSYPVIKNRWLWSWELGIHDFKKYIDMMSEWKYNGLVMWNSVIPDNIRELIDYAHKIGIKIMLGFSWGYPDFTQNYFIKKFGKKTEKYYNIVTEKKDLLCPTNTINKKWIEDFVVKRFKKEYYALNMDGIYFQAFTESNRCPCPECSEFSTAELFINWCLPIRNKLKKIRPDLFVSWGIHTWWGNIQFKEWLGKEVSGGIKPIEYLFFRKIPKQDQLLWEGAEYPEKNLENTYKLLTIRGCNENVGLLHRIYGSYGLTLSNNNEISVHKDIIKKWSKIENNWVARDGKWHNIESIKRYIEWCRAISSNCANTKTIVHLLEGTDWGYYNRIVPMLTAEIEWNPERNQKDFNILFNNIKTISDLSKQSSLYRKYKEKVGLCNEN